MCGEHSLDVDRLAPFVVNGNGVGAGPADHVDHPPTKDAIDADHDGVARSDEVDNGGFHPGRPGCRHGKRQRVCGAEYRAQPNVGLIEQGDELRVEVTEHWPAERLHSLGIGVARAGAHEDAIGQRHVADDMRWPRCNASLGA